jgi:pimeloyl-ACP methyl ester carboxylesterase
MGAHSWAENLEPLLGHFRIYAIDNIGEGNRSELIDPLVFPRSPGEVAELYASIANSLGIERCPVLGSSNGGFIAQTYAFHYPEKVESLALFGPMGLTQLTGGSIFMMTLPTLYPLKPVRNFVMKWALGEDEYCLHKYGDWFNAVMKSTVPSVAGPVPMSPEQKRTMELPVLLFLGTEDALVGDAALAKEAAELYPNIEIEILGSGHLIAVEQRDAVNSKLSEFLAIHD